MTLISISNFFAMASFLVRATYFFKSFCYEFQNFAYADLILNSSTFIKSASTSVRHDAWVWMGARTVILVDESIVLLLQVEVEGQRDVDIVGDDSTAMDVDLSRLILLRSWYSRGRHQAAMWVSHH